MTTTILPSMRSFDGHTVIQDRAFQIANLLLALHYLIVELFLISVPVKHGHGGGIGPGMGNAIAVFLPAFTILFLLLILFHLISFFHHHLPDHLGIGVGFSQVIIGTLILGSLLLSRQSYTLLQALYPLTSLIVFSLALSLILGIYLVIRDLRNRHQTLKADSRNVSQFPLPMNRY
ncbi:hypothetical protein, partial [Methanospirillum sp.]|uniref:hypothetical protein n=1 Tax=Methanospirillum sp. TaxID=45200 RepID=UPI002C76A341